MKIFYKMLLFIVISISFCGCAFAGNVDAIKQNIIRQAKIMGVEPAIVLSIAKTESEFSQNAVGAGGQIGIFQLSPATAKSMGINPYNIDENIKGGITYYKAMYNKLGSMELAVAAYNTGLGVIQRNNNKIPDRTKPFVSRIMSDYKKYKSMGL